MELCDVDSERDQSRQQGRLVSRVLTSGRRRAAFQAREAVPVASWKGGDATPAGWRVVEPAPGTPHPAQWIAGYAKSFPAAPRQPCRTTSRAFGLTMNQANPEGCAPPFGLIGVLSAPHSFPFAYITCCTPVSFESGVEAHVRCVVRRRRPDVSWELGPPNRFTPSCVHTRGCPGCRLGTVL